MMKFRLRWQVFVGLALFLFLTQYFIRGSGSKVWKPAKKERFPRVWEVLSQESTHGGVWLIPQSWLSPNQPKPSDIVQAARLVSTIADAEPKRYISNTRIPRIIHQTWKSTDIEKIPDGDLGGMEAWLQYASTTGEESAYFFWLDDGGEDLMKQFEPEAIKYIDLLPDAVQKSDAFRVIVCNTIGGVYADLDTIPLRNPATWVEPSDLSLWTDPQTRQTYGQDITNSSSIESQPLIDAILGLEADKPEDTDRWWRIGYEYPVQLTQWALAGARNSTVLNRFVTNLQGDIQAAAEEAEAKGKTTSSILKKINTIALTGPAAVTKAAKDYMAERYDLRWQAISGIEDGGRSKAVGETLILPITGFSPGRGTRDNMGSRPISHKDARLKHNFQGSWKKVDLRVEYGKFCRTFFGRCRYWSKVPS